MNAQTLVAKVLKTALDRFRNVAKSARRGACVTARGNAARITDLPDAANDLLARSAK